MRELEVSVRRHQGVSSECETCRVNSYIGDQDPVQISDLTTAELAGLMRRNAWASNATTEMMGQLKHLREVRENTLAILARDGALGELEAAGMVPGSLVLLADFANGQDDAALMDLIRGPVKQPYFGGG